MRNLKALPFIWILLGFSAGVFLLLAILEGADQQNLWSIVRLVPQVVTADSVLITLFVTRWWRWRVLQNWLVPFPDLDGSWDGFIQTTWVNPETGKTPGRIPVLLAIRQSFTQISCVMHTAEMSSHSYAADFILDEPGQIRRLVYSYRSSPRPTVAHRSPPHDGTIVFDIVVKPRRALDGRYWTERKTTGEIHLHFRTKQRLERLPSDLHDHPVSGD